MWKWKPILHLFQWETMFHGKLTSTKNVEYFLPHVHLQYIGILFLWKIVFHRTADEHVEGCFPHFRWKSTFHGTLFPTKKDGRLISIFTWIPPKDINWFSYSKIRNTGLSALTLSHLFSTPSEGDIFANLASIFSQHCGHCGKVLTCLRIRRTGDTWHTGHLTISIIRTCLAF